MPNIDLAQTLRPDWADCAHFMVTYQRQCTLQIFAFVVRDPPCVTRSIHVSNWRIGVSIDTTVRTTSLSTRTCAKSAVVAWWHATNKACPNLSDNLSTVKNNSTGKKISSPVFFPALPGKICTVWTLLLRLTGYSLYIGVLVFWRLVCGKWRVVCSRGCFAPRCRCGGREGRVRDI